MQKSAKKPIMDELLSKLMRHSRFVQATHIESDYNSFA